MNEISSSRKLMHLRDNVPEATNVAAVSAIGAILSVTSVVIRQGSQGADKKLAHVVAGDILDHLAAGFDFFP